MKLVQTLLFIFFAFVANGQDINYKQDIRFTLAHGNSRKWVGVEKTQTLNGSSSANLIFNASHKVEEQPINSHKYPVVKQWRLITGTTTHDEKIELEIGDITYAVVFSKTANGSDFMTLTYFKNERAVTVSYYSE